MRARVAAGTVAPRAPRRSARRRCSSELCAHSAQLTLCACSANVIAAAAASASRLRRRRLRCSAQPSAARGSVVCSQMLGCSAAILHGLSCRGPHGAPMAPCAVAQIVSFIVDERCPVILGRRAGIHRLPRGCGSQAGHPSLQTLKGPVTLAAPRGQRGPRDDGDRPAPRRSHPPEPRPRASSPVPLACSHAMRRRWE